MEKSPFEQGISEKQRYEPFSEKPLPQLWKCLLALSASRLQRVSDLPAMRIGLACSPDWVRDAMFPPRDVESVKPTPYSIVHKDFHYLIEISNHHRRHQVAIFIHHESC